MKKAAWVADTQAANAFNFSLNARKFSMKSALLAIALVTIGAAAQAQTNGATAQQQATGTGTASIASGAVTVQSFGAQQLPQTWAAIDSNIHTNQAMSAPPVYGSAAPSAGGCPLVDGWSLSVVIANGGKSDGKEMPGCMLNLLADRIGTLKTVKQLDKEGKPTGVEVFDGASVMKLESWCLFPLYRTAIENSGMYRCKATRDEEERRAQAILNGQPDPKPVATLPKPYMPGG